MLSAALGEEYAVEFEYRDGTETNGIDENSGQADSVDADEQA